MADARTFTNWLGQEVAVGDTVIYPTSSGYSTQLTEGTVLAITALDEQEAYKKNGRRRLQGGEWEQLPDEKWRPTIGRPTSIKILPTGRSSRWDHYLWSNRSGKDQSPVTLTKNAPSVILAAPSKN